MAQGQGEGTAAAGAGEGGPGTVGRGRTGWAVWCVLFLVLATLLTLGRVAGHDFVNYDDNVYVYENPAVRQGLSPAGVRWALTATVATNWHPLTWLSHMLDVSLYGLRPAGHHLTSLVLHAAAAAVLCLFLSALTGSLPAALLASLLFALHPLHVESVAWVAERKDLLSTLLWFAAAWAWLGYCRSRRALPWGGAILLHALALMAKPMPVTLPFTLLLLDGWPLGRFARRERGGEGWAALVLEKAPLFVLSAASSVVTYRVQAGGGAVNIMEGYHLAGRLQNALTAYLGYLVKTVWPSCLILPYTLTRESFALPKVLLAALVLAGVGAAAVHLRRRFPPLAVGWLWYLGTLVPVIGLVQVGSQAMADRYTYVPLTGLFLAGAWAWASAYRGRPARRPLLAGGALLALALLSWLSFRQAGFWRDSGTLFTHTLDCDPKSFVAHNNLGAHHSDRKDYARAMEHIREALRINAFFAEAHYNLGNVLVRTGRVAESVEHFRAALHGKPDMAMAHNNLGLALASLGRMAEAGDALSRALALQPDSPEALYNLGYLRYLEGRPAEAERLFLRSLARNPSSFEAHNVLGIVYAQQGRVDDAVRHFETALSLNPADQFTRQNLEKARRMAGR